MPEALREVICYDARTNVGTREAQNVNVALNSLIPFLSERGRTILDASEQDLAAYLNAMVSRGVQASSVTRMRSTLRGMYRRLGQRGLALANPAQGLREYAFKRKPARVRTQTTLVNKVIDHAVAAWQRQRPGSYNHLVYARRVALFGIISEGSVLLSELECLGARSFDPTRGELTFVTNGGETNRLQLPEKIAEALRDYRRGLAARQRGNCEALFVAAHAPGNPMSLESIHKDMELTIRQAGFEGKLRPSHFHRVKSNQSLDLGFDWDVARMAAGYTDLPDVQYARVEFDELARQIERYHPFGVHAPDLIPS